jgi:hypothetical protein
VVYQSSNIVTVKSARQGDAVQAYRDPRNLRKVKQAIEDHPITVRLGLGLGKRKADSR